MTTVSALEGARLVLVLVCLAALWWAFAHSRDGVLAFARPIRQRMVTRRRWQIAKDAGIVLVIGCQTASAAMVPDPPVISTAGMAVSYVMLWILALTLASTLMFSVGWRNVAEILANTPLQPDDRERLMESSAAGRELGHLIANSLQYPVGVLSTLEGDPKLTAAQWAEIRRALAALEQLGAEARALHTTIRAAAE